MLFEPSATSSEEKMNLNRPHTTHMFWVSALLGWFAERKRDMPWRRDRPRPYAVWVSEIMLQQTQVATVIPYFRRFMMRFPTIARLAKAELQDVLKAWEGLGYYSRARNLHQAARELAARRGGRIPRTAAGLQELPGIGAYTAAAIASICFREAVPVLDGNVLRVFTRFLGIAEVSNSPRVRRKILDFLAAHIPQSAPGDFNQAMMELGATVCRPRKPECGACPLARGCVALKTRRTEVLPVRPKARKTPEVEVAVGIVRKKGRVLIARRPADRMLGGLWEFPGGKRKRGESLSETVRREFREETGLRVRVGRKLCLVRHAYSHFRIRLHVFECRHEGGRAKAKSGAEVRWVPVRRLRDYPLPAANQRILHVLLSPCHEEC